MRNLVKRSRFTGYKGFDRIGREAKRNMREFTDTNTIQKPSTMATAKASNPFIGDNFFTTNPDKVLGVQSIEHGRYGNEIIKVKGDINSIDKIDAAPIAVIDLYPTQEFTTENKEEIIQQVFENEVAADHEKKIKKLRKPGKEPQTQTNLQGNQEVYTFREISEQYNKDISRDEMDAYYFTHPELNCKLLIDEIKLSKQEMIEKGLICWDKGQFVYVYTYQSGNIGKKLMELKRDREKMVAATSDAQYDRQIQMLESVRPKEKGLVGDDKLLILPHSGFAKSINILELRPGAPELNASMPLPNAFKIWLKSLPPDEFDKSNYVEIIEYYVDNKVIPIDRSRGKDHEAKEEKKAINIRQRTKLEGDNLFTKFLAEELLPDDQARVTHLWNEKFNSFVEPNLSKTPVCFQMSKTFKAGAPFQLNPTQRQAAAFMQEKKSGLLAYSVGVGKTAASIVCMAQAHYNGFCDFPIFIVPTNTYENWIAELQGKVDKQSGQFIQGIMPQLPPVVGLYNMNPAIVKNELKTYSADDQRQFDQVEEMIAIVRKMEVKHFFSKEQMDAINKKYPLNFVGLEEEYHQSFSTRSFQDYVVNYLKDDYNYKIYELGQIKKFEKGTVFVATENGLQRLGLREQNANRLKGSMYRILSQGESYQGKKRDAKAEKDRAKLELMIDQRMSKSQRNARIYIEDIKIDWVCFDEEHYYKKLFTTVKGEIKEGEQKTEGKVERQKTKYELKSGAQPSARALSAFMLSHYIQTTHDNRNVVGLTATPFTNSPLEVFSMLVLTNYAALEDMGLSNMVDFFDTFMKINYDIKYTPQKTVVKDVVLTGYNNLSNLRQVIYSLMDKKDEGANLKRPTKLMWPSLEKGIETTIPMTAEQDELIAQVKKYINGDIDLGNICQHAVNEDIEEYDFDGMDDEAIVSEWEKVTTNEFVGERDFLSDSKRDNLIKQIKSAMKKASGVEFDTKDLDKDESLGVRCLRAIAMMRQITLSPYLFYKACSKVKQEKYDLPNYKDYINTSPKLKYTMGCIKSVIDFHVAHNERISGQVIYMNAGVEYFPLIKEYLVKELHLKDYQVGIVSGGMTKSAKERIKEKFLTGEILVLIGSQTISVGVNLQNNATVLYNLYFDWNPTDAAQIEGRIWRQGNRFAFVRIVYPQCYNSADPVIFEYLNAKTLRINEIWNRSSEVQELDLRDFNPKELQKKLITDPIEKAEWEILEETDKIQNEILHFENRRELLTRALGSFKDYKKTRPEAIDYMNQIAQKRVEVKREQAIQRNKNKVAELAEKYAQDPEKMVAEIQKYNKDKYDHVNDPEGKYTIKNYTDATDEEILPDILKLRDVLVELDVEDAGKWGSLYRNRSEIIDTLNRMYYLYKDMRAAEERVLKPLRLSFDTATNPINEFDNKLIALAQQMDAIQDSKPEKILRYTKEYKESLKTLKTVEDRVAEFAAANEQLLPPQLILTNTEPIVEDITHEIVEPAIPGIKVEEALPETIESKAERFGLPTAVTFEDIDKNIDTIISGYANRKMAVVQTEAYLHEIQELAKKYLEDKGITTREQFAEFIAKKQAKARAGKGKEKEKARKFTQQEKTEESISAIEKMALEASAEMEEKISGTTTIPVEAKDKDVVVDKTLKVIESIINKNPEVIDKLIEINTNKKYTPITDAKVNVFSEIEDIVNGDESHPGLQVRIDNIVVPKSKRNSGIGRKEFNSIVDWAKSIGAEDIVLESKRSAIPFWEKMGFEIEDQGDKISTGVLKLNNQSKAIAESYHKAKENGSNLEYVKAVEKFLSTYPEIKISQTIDDAQFEPFAEIVRNSDSLKDAIYKIKQKKDVSAAVAKAFRDKYDPDRTSTPEKAFEIFYNEVKEKQEPKNTVQYEHIGDTDVDQAKMTWEIPKIEASGVIFTGMVTSNARMYNVMKIARELDYMPSDLDFFYLGDGEWGIFIKKNAKHGYEDTPMLPGGYNRKKEAELLSKIENQIEALTLSREFADVDKQAEIDQQIEALQLTLNFI